MKILITLVVLLIGIQAVNSYLAYGAYRQYQADRIADLEARQAEQARVLAVNLDLLTYPDDQVDLSVLNAWSRLAVEYTAWATEDMTEKAE